MQLYLLTTPTKKSTLKANKDCWPFYFRRDISWHLV
nr:MAG TPA: hypothetical protein [Caudoviricetes sp.]